MGRLRGQGEFGEELEAVFGAGAEGVEAAERLEGERDGGLEGGDAHRSISDYKPRLQGR